MVFQYYNVADKATEAVDNNYVDLKKFELYLKIDIFFSKYLVSLYFYFQDIFSYYFLCVTGEVPASQELLPWATKAN